MKPTAISVIAIALGILAAGVVVGAVLKPGGSVGPASGSVGGCSSSTSPGVPGTSIPARAFRLVGEIENNNSNPYGGPVPQTRITIESSATSQYFVYLMSQSQYGSQPGLGNGTGGQGTAVGPATSFVWSSGPVTSCSYSILVGNGNWYIVLYNPSTTAVASVSISTGSGSP
jgi:hypothetical protein